jgi:hypothetical protein
VLLAEWKDSRQPAMPGLMVGKVDHVDRTDFAGAMNRFAPWWSPSSSYWRPESPKLD